MVKYSNLEKGVLLGVVVLVLFLETLFFFVVSPEHYLRIAALLLALDFVAVGLFVFSRQIRLRTSGNRFKELKTALQVVLDLTSAQHANWSKMLQGVASLEPDDLMPLISLHETVDALDNTKTQVSGKATQNQGTVESVIDSIQTIILLNQGLMADLDRVLKFYEATYQRFQEARERNDMSHFRLNESVGFLSDMGKASNTYSEKLVLEVIESFREINRFSEDIGTKVTGTMHRLMDGSRSESLGAINRESKVVSQTMDRFFGDLEKAIHFSQTSVTENLAQIDRVKVMAEAISEFSESIRMISLNLNIEAARVTGHSSASGRSFQVLAVKLSEFALKAQSLAKQQADIIATASEVISTTGGQEMELLNSLRKQVPGIQGQLAPFSAIIEQTYNQFTGVEETMNSLTQSINERLKAVIGKLQFQDLVRQEQEHVLQMFSYVRDLAIDATTSRAIAPHLQVELRQALIHHYECMASTENELAVVKAYRESHGTLKQGGDCKDAEESLSAGSVSLF